MLPCWFTRRRNFLEHTHTHLLFLLLLLLLDFHKTTSGHSSHAQLPMSGVFYDSGLLGM